MHNGLLLCKPFCSSVQFVGDAHIKEPKKVSLSSQHRKACAISRKATKASQPLNV